MASKKFGYTVVAYPESMPEDWEARLEKLPFGYCSALHDKDWEVNEDGEKTIKKAHIHFLFQAGATAKQKKYIHASLGAHYGEDVHNHTRMYDYLTHENHSNKTHYSRDIIQYSSKWSQEAFEMHYEPERNLMRELVGIIQEKEFIEYSDLLNHLIELGDETLQRASKQVWVMKYLDSLRYR